MRLIQAANCVSSRLVRLVLDHWAANVCVARMICICMKINAFHNVLEDSGPQSLVNVRPVLWDATHVRRVNVSCVRRTMS